MRSFPALLAAAILLGSLLLTSTVTGAPTPTPLGSIKAFEAELALARTNVSTNATAALAHLETARGLYVTNLQPTARARDAATDKFVLAELTAATERIAAGDVTGFAVESQYLKKVQYRIAYLQMWYHLNVSSDVGKAKPWFDVLAWKFKWTADDEAVHAMEEILEDPGTLSHESQEIHEATIEQFVDKVVEEGSEAKGNLVKDRAEAREQAAEATAYFMAIGEEVEEESGAETRYAIEGYLHALVVAVDADDATSLARALAGYQSLLTYFETGYRPGDLAGATARIATLMDLVVKEYTLAVGPEGGSILDQEEYDEAVLFANDAKGLFGQSFAEAYQADADLTVDVFADINATITLIEQKARPSQVDVEVLEVKAHLAEIGGGPGGEPLTPAQHIERIEELLDKAVAEYKEGDHAAAGDVVTEAYIYHFEGIEAPLAAKDQDLMENLEVAISTDLRRMIEEGKPTSEVEEKVRSIKGDLVEAEGLLSGQTQPSTAQPSGPSPMLIAIFVGVIAIESLAVLYLWARLEAARRPLDAAGATATPRHGGGTRPTADNTADDHRSRGGHDEE